MLINENKIKSENYAIKLGKRTFLSLWLSFNTMSSELVVVVVIIIYNMISAIYYNFNKL